MSAPPKIRRGSPPPSAERSRRGVLIPMAGAAICAGVVWGLWRFFVTTPAGQLIDDAAWQGSTFGRRTITTMTMPVLDLVSVPFILAAVVAAVLLAFAQRRWTIAGAAVVLLAGANVTTQLLKDLLTRPDLGLTEVHSNSLPSGHTTVAASVAATALLIAPTRWRGTVAVAGATYAALTGLATMADAWHRPSDVVAAFAVAGFWYFLVEAARGIPATSPLERGYRGAPAAGAHTVLAVIAVLGGIVTVITLAVTAAAGGDVTSRGEVIAYAGSCLGVVAAAAVAMLAMLAMRPHHLASPESAGA